ncbi:hypothetical protein C7120_08960 [Prevotella sp. oral taxon 376]|uniref:hypothetical protein n=1 Tax=Prevotella sp. oral taxon 376 TaxID=712466 RepID=UPI000D1E9BDB|nr:hypothetical protein [Prevotella sp. oral taxon 376]PTL34619.1 hypothetical protein C7120_08960 [Prevotella sp. oral taxon 376]
MKRNDLSQFTFELVSSGCYRVHYFTEKRGDFWVYGIHDMLIIDATLHAEVAKAKDIKALRDIVKRNGTHYHANGKEF